jgi:two-component system chemotaxis response regulator CheY
MDVKLNRGLRPDGRPYRVLLVDDSLFVKKQLTKILSDEGFEIIDTASHGKEAVDKYSLQGSDIDLVTMDITMPGMDGVTALEKIMEMDQEARVVMITAIGKQDLVKKSIMLGAAGYIVKPLDPEKVLGNIQRALPG